MKKIFYSILDVLYPGRCPVCHRILKDKRASVCPECRDTFRPVRGHYCLKCGKPVKPDEEYCRECGKGTRSFDRGRGVFLYDGIMRRSLVRYKSDNPRLSKTHQTLLHSRLWSLHLPLYSKRSYLRSMITSTSLHNPFPIGLTRTKKERLNLSTRKTIQVSHLYSDVSFIFYLIKIAAKEQQSLNSHKVYLCY